MTYMRTQSPNASISGKPLLFWALTNPEYVAVLLRRGANPNIRCWISEDTCVSPLYALLCRVRTPKVHKQRELVKDMLKFSGARALRYSDFHVIDIK